jgi:type I restriction enzyme R subunit
MGNVTDIERITQNRIVKLFKERLSYTYLGNWEEREGNSNIEVALLTKYLERQGYSPAHISKAIFELQSVATNFNDSLYTTNKAVYELLRFGVKVKVNAGDNYETVKRFLNCSQWLPISTIACILPIKKCTRNYALVCRSK